MCWCIQVRTGKSGSQVIFIGSGLKCRFHLHALWTPLHLATHSGSACSLCDLVYTFSTYLWAAHRVRTHARTYVRTYMDGTLLIHNFHPIYVDWGRVCQRRYRHRLVQVPDIMTMLIERIMWRDITSVALSCRLDDLTTATQITNCFQTEGVLTAHRSFDLIRCRRTLLRSVAVEFHWAPRSQTASRKICLAAITVVSAERLINFN